MYKRWSRTLPLIPAGSLCLCPLGALAQDGTQELVRQYEEYQSRFEAIEMWVIFRKTGMPP